MMPGLDVLISTLFGQLSASFSSLPMHEAEIRQHCRVIYGGGEWFSKTSKLGVVHCQNSHTQPKRSLRINAMYYIHKTQIVQLCTYTVVAL